MLLNKLAFEGGAPRTLVKSASCIPTPTDFEMLACLARGTNSRFSSDDYADGFTRRFGYDTTMMDRDTRELILGASAILLFAIVLVLLQQ